MKTLVEKPGDIVWGDCLSVPLVVLGYLAESLKEDSSQSAVRSTDTSVVQNNSCILNETCRRPGIVLKAEGLGKFLFFGLESVQERAVRVRSIHVPRVWVGTVEVEATEIRSS